MKYEILYADFPWPYTSFGTAKLPYKHMTEEGIAAFDWSRFMAKHCVLFAWVTGPKQDIAFRCAEEWRKRHGLHYQGVAFVWIKTKLDGTPIRASGPRPRLIKPLDEFVLAFSTTPNRRTFPLLDESVEQNVFWPKQRKHSRKPPEVRDRIVQLLGDRTRIELFATEEVHGWDGWGDQYPGTNSLLQTLRRRLKQEYECPPQVAWASYERGHDSDGDDAIFVSITLDPEVELEGDDFRFIQDVVENKLKSDGVTAWIYVDFYDA